MPSPLSNETQRWHKEITTRFMSEFHWYNECKGILEVARENGVDIGQELVKTNK